MTDLVKKILYGRDFAALEIFSENNEDKAAFIIVKKSNNQINLTIKKLYTGLGEIKGIKTNAPVAIILNNAHVLQKGINDKDNNDSKLLYKAFPSLVLDDFYYEIWRTKSSSIIAVCRKTYLHEFIQSLSPGLKIQSVSLGITGFSSLSGFTLPDSIAMNTCTLNFNDDYIISDKKDLLQDTISLNGLEISRNYILAFSAVLNSIISGNKNTGNISEYNYGLEREYTRGAFFNTGLKAGLGIILLLLVANFFIFSYYYERTNLTGGSSVTNQQIADNLKKIKERVKSKEEKVKYLLNTSNNKNSYIINQIAKLIPASIALSELNYRPLQKKQKEGEELVFDETIVIISGTTINNDEFTSWVEYLGKIEEVKDVVITSFGKNESSSTGFTLRINLK